MTFTRTFNHIRNDIVSVPGMTLALTSSVVFIDCDCDFSSRALISAIFCGQWISKKRNNGNTMIYISEPLVAKVNDGSHNYLLTFPLYNTAHGQMWQTSQKKP